MRWTQEQFDVQISNPGSVSGAVYQANKDMFDEAVRQGKIRVWKERETQISHGGGIDTQSTYRWESGRNNNGSLGN